MPHTVAVVILTYNEELNIQDCLDSIGGWASETFVVDSYSTDSTVDLVLARNDPALRITQHEFINYSQQWEWAITQLPIGAQWTLKLDADERLNDHFKEEVSRRLASADDQEIQGLSFRRSTIFLGRRLRHVGLLPYDLRLWKTGYARMDGNPMNEHVLVEGATDRLISAVDHHDNKSVADWLDKHNRYSSTVAALRYAGGYKSHIQADPLGDPAQRRKFWERLYHQLPFRNAFMLLYLLCIKGGLLDGHHGFHYCLLRAFYFYVTDLKVLEANIVSRPPPTPGTKRGEPHPILTKRHELEEQDDKS